MKTKSVLVRLVLVASLFTFVGCDAGGYQERIERRSDELREGGSENEDFDASINSRLEMFI